MNLSSRASLIVIGVLIVVAPLVAYAQWSEPESGELIIRGGWIFDSVSDTRRRNSGIVIQKQQILTIGFFGRASATADETLVTGIAQHGDPLDPGQ